jgi:hypothetical protein
MKSRTWSSAITTIARPRTMSIEATRRFSGLAAGTLSVSMEALLFGLDLFRTGVDA